MYNEKYRNATYITVFDGVCQFLTTLSGMELLHNLQRCTHALTYTIHSRYTPALAVFLELLECAFSSHYLLLKVVRLIETWANFCWGRRRVSQGTQEAL